MSKKQDSQPAEKPHFSVKISDESSPGIQLDMFSEDITDKYIGSTSKHKGSGVFIKDTSSRIINRTITPVPMTPTESKIRPSLIKNPNLWTSELISLYNTAVELHDKAEKSGTLIDIKVSNVAQNKYMQEVKKLKDYLRDKYLSHLISEIPRIDVIKRPKNVKNQQKKNSSVVVKSPQIYIMPSTEKEMNTEVENQQKEESPVKSPQTYAVPTKNKRVYLIMKKQPKEIPTHTKAIKKNPNEQNFKNIQVINNFKTASHRQIATMMAKSTINITNSTISNRTVTPVPMTTTESKIPASPNSNQTKPTVAKPVINKKPVMTKPALVKDHSITVQYQHPKGVPRAFLDPSHPMSVNYTNMPGFPFLALPQVQIPFATPGQMQDPHVQPSPLFVQQHSFVQSFNQPTEHGGNELQQTQANTGETFVVDNNDNSQGSVIDDGESSENPGGQKRVRAFDRLGPITQPKKPKLTINLLFSKEQAVREVIDDENQEEPVEVQPLPEYVPVPERKEIMSSTNDVVVKYLPQWPWTMGFNVIKTTMARSSKSVMIMESEQMAEVYERNNVFVKVNVSGYPPTFTKEDLLDIVLINLKDRPFIPCFIEFKPTECNFLVLRSRPALMLLHRNNLAITHDKMELAVKLSLTDLKLDALPFIPKKILNNMVTECLVEENSLDLHAFCLGPDISNFIYYPLNRIENQQELFFLKSRTFWTNLTELNLSYNRLTSLEGFELANRVPQLQYLDLSFNNLTKMTDLLCCKGLSLRALKLEGNPLCRDYTDPDYYLKVARMLFPRLREFDGVLKPRKGELPEILQNYCPEPAKALAEKFVDTFFPLLEQNPEDRQSMEEMYSDDAVMTITYRYRLRYNPVFRHFHELFSRCRVLEEIDLDAISGAKNIVKHLVKWPQLKHDPYMTTVDVMSHEDSTTILRLGGVMRVTTSKSLADEEPMIAFTRTVVLHSSNGVTYKIHNEMVQWDEIEEELAKAAFQITAIKPRQISLEFDTEPDDDLKEGLSNIFMEVTRLNFNQSKRCLGIKNWNFKEAMEYFIKLVKLGSTDILDLNGN